MTAFTPQQHLNERAWRVLVKAQEYCEQLIRRVTAITNGYLGENQLDPADVCFIVVGSVGRFEALEASDLDFTPVLRTPEALKTFRPHDQPLRQRLRQQLSMDVSKGEELTAPATLQELSRADLIGSKEDGSDKLTRRILILTEGKQAGGSLPIPDIRRPILEAYSGEDRSRGRHVLSLCNDLTRYYRTVCIEYKSKVEGREEKWGMRNMKLRHNRKFWFFSCILTIVHLAETNPQGNEPYIQGLLEAFERPPFQRLFDSVGERRQGMAGRVAEPFAWFLEFTSDRARRAALEAVPWETRYDMNLDNPFPAAKFNSDRMHQEMLALMDSLSPDQRHRILDWFLL
jgi:hypothetical protein